MVAQPNREDSGDKPAAAGTSRPEAVHAGKLARKRPAVARTLQRLRRL